MLLGYQPVKNRINTTLAKTEGFIGSGADFGNQLVSVHFLLGEKAQNEELGDSVNIEGLFHMVFIIPHVPMLASIKL